MKVHLKIHGSKDTARANSGRKKMAYEVVCIKSDKPRVPEYKFHHVEISRNILTPNTMLKFIPHLRDMKDNEEERYSRWIKELEAMDAQSGFNVTSLNRGDKMRKRLKEEIAAEISLYIDRWTAKLGLDNCSKSSLVRYMATQPEHNDKMTPQQKNTIINKLDEVSSPRATKTAKMFTEAFNHLWKHTELTLKDVLAHDETVEAVVENKKLVKDEKPEAKSKVAERLLEMVESNLLTYTILGCLYCYSHSCEHGEYDRRFGGLMRQNMAKHLRDPQSSAGRSPTRCRNLCWQDYRSGNLQLGLDKYESLYELASPDPDPPKVKPLPWYDRHRKELKQDWQDHLNAHEFTRREVKDPCTHSGPCGKGCPCVDAKLLCCGAFDRADPKNAHDNDLHSYGCQNVALQRGVSKTVLLGESQIEGCGYGLFTAEDIAQDEFVIEYLGELISHDEGVRREARRGDVFDDSKHSSYLFTLLDYEGIWVDAAIYGNLSRYINHASEYDKVGKKLVNIVPQILFVNGDYRIKFKAQRDIKAGEELFFNYGENFPNLTKKLLDSKDEENQPKRGGTVRGRGGRGRGGRGRGRGSLKITTTGTKKAPRATLEEEDEVSSVEPVVIDDPDNEDDGDFRPGRSYKPRRAGTVLGDFTTKRARSKRAVNGISLQGKRGGEKGVRGTLSPDGTEITSEKDTVEESHRSPDVEHSGRNAAAKKGPRRQITRRKDVRNTADPSAETLLNRQRFNEGLRRGLLQAATNNSPLPDWLRQRKQYDRAGEFYARLKPELVSPRRRDHAKIKRMLAELNSSQQQGGEHHGGAGQKASGQDSGDIISAEWPAEATHQQLTSVGRHIQHSMDARSVAGLGDFGVPLKTEPLSSKCDEIKDSGRQGAWAPAHEPCSAGRMEQEKMEEGEEQVVDDDDDDDSDDDVFVRRRNRLLVRQQIEEEL
ncbi:hypothetical protein KVR01_006555 [Diaporthe batatas]|uniref:uncharacterized protein n=1 Tax=Diaporthe batatas TaxID=748121 RepID=UPI001D0418F9|nr:uncharacterized protein KVR01_006555 [Diaporthe batatas]KAG8163258.1 hypothetical protein KVR01_006555 [Diaporthe batatas]